MDAVRDSEIRVRVATDADVPALRELIPFSARVLSREFYSDGEIESAIEHVFGVDSQLVADGTYLVAEASAMLVGCGGWSRRRTLYGGDQMKPHEDPLLDPARDPARIRAFFVHPDWARRGIGAAILRACIAAARAAGFRELELAATLPGVPLYAAFGFDARERTAAPLPDGTRLPIVRMTRSIEDR
jgi:GNAT superfamily N-acetyltransferase